MPARKQAPFSSLPVNRAEQSESMSRSSTITARERSPAVFLDKDGTLVNDVPYNVDPSLIELAVGAAEGAALLSAAGYALVIVSNQSGVARGLFSEAAIAGVEARVRELLVECDAPLA